jgi:hypothetical protein
MLKKARDVRNACAHSASIKNRLGTNGHVAMPAPSELTTALSEAGFPSGRAEPATPADGDTPAPAQTHGRETALADGASARLRPLADDVRAGLSGHHRTGPPSIRTCTADFRNRSYEVCN